MKKILCPKCDFPVIYEETRYLPGQSLIFECEHCRKKFTFRVPQEGEEEERESFGSLTVIENSFCFKQTLELIEGDNLIGRYNKGTVIQQPIDTKDPSMDRRHCILNVKRQIDGTLLYTLRDNASITGTFVMNRLLGNKERLRIEEGAILTLGATTLILHTPQGEAEETAPQKKDK